jgi:hypothetical protein
MGFSSSLEMYYMSQSWQESIIGQSINKKKLQGEI